MNSPVLDASALLAYLTDEPGADLVVEAIAIGAAMSTVNLAEVLGRLDPAAPEEIDRELRRQGLIDGGITLHPFTHDDAVAVAQLREPTRAAGLSLGDRACLVLGVRLRAPVLTADRVWETLDLPGEVRLIRGPGRLG